MRDEATCMPSVTQDWASEQGLAPIGMFYKCFPRHGKPPAKSTVEQLQPPLIVTDSTPKNCRPPCVFFFFFGTWPTTAWLHNEQIKLDGALCGFSGFSNSLLLFLYRD